MTIPNSKDVDDVEENKQFYDWQDSHYQNMSQNNWFKTMESLNEQAFLLLYIYIKNKLRDIRYVHSCSGTVKVIGRE